MFSLPKNAAVRKINELVKRARLAKVHAYILSHLRDEMPSFMGKDKKQKELIEGKIFFIHFSWKFLRIFLFDFVTIKSDLLFNSFNSFFIYFIFIFYYFYYFIFILFYFF